MLKNARVSCTFVIGVFLCQRRRTYLLFSFSVNCERRLVSVKRAVNSLYIFKQVFILHSDVCVRVWVCVCVCTSPGKFYLIRTRNTSWSILQNRLCACSCLLLTTVAVVVLASTETIIIVSLHCRLCRGNTWILSLVTKSVVVVYTPNNLCVSTVHVVTWGPFTVRVRKSVRNSEI
jgi:hypothetical protein